MLRRALMLLALALLAGPATANNIFGYLGGGLGFPLKPQAYADSHQASFQGEVGGGYYLSPQFGLGIEAGGETFPLRTDRLNLPAGYTVAGGDDSVLYYDFQLRLQSKARQSAGGFAFVGFGMLQEGTDAYTVSLNGTEVGTVDAAIYDPALIGVFGAGMHFGNFGRISLYTELKLIATRDDSDAARFTQWSLGLMY